MVAHFFQRESPPHIRLQHVLNEVFAFRASKAFWQRPIIAEAYIAKRSRYVARIVTIFERVDAGGHEVERDSHAPHVRERGIVRFPS